MQPTHRFRWHGYRNPATAAAVAAYRHEHGGSLAAAKLAVEQETPLVLQQWWQGADGGEWRGVDVVVEPHPGAREMASASDGRLEDASRRPASAQTIEHSPHSGREQRFPRRR